MIFYGDAVQAMFDELEEMVE